jgi:hypothetical protein
MSWPAAVLWVMIFAAALSQGPWLIYLLFAAGAFGTLQMLPGDGGGVNLLPQSACAAILVAKVLLQRGNIPRAVDAALDPGRLAIFTAFIVYGIIGAFSLPRLFAGLTDVVPVSGGQVGTDVLRPSSGNVTQSCYMLLSYGTTLAFCMIGATDAMRRHYALANVGAGLVIVVTGLVDLVFFTAGLSDLLAPFRTATYALLADVETDGIKRVVGLMPEASAYGALCVGTGGALVFLRPFLRKGRESLIATGTLIMLLAMGALSTSSGAYVGLGVLSGVYGCNLFVRVMGRDQKDARRAQTELTLLFLLAIAMVGAFVFRPSLYDPVYDMVDKIVFQKTTTASYIERTSWTQAGWQAFLDSGSLGVGIGSIRVSNWGVSILGSTGVFGALLMFSFLIQQLAFRPRNAPEPVRRFCGAVQLSLLPVLVVSQLSATMPDLGIPLAAALGILAAPRRSSPSSAPSADRGVAARAPRNPPSREAMARPALQGAGELAPSAFER